MIITIIIISFVWFLFGAYYFAKIDYTFKHLNFEWFDKLFIFIIGPLNFFIYLGMELEERNQQIKKYNEK